MQIDNIDELCQMISSFRCDHMHDKSPIFVDSGHGKIWMFGILDTLCGVRAEKQYRLSSRIDKFETRAHVVDVFARDLLQSRTDAMLTTDTVP